MDDHIVCFDVTAVKIALDGSVCKMEEREENGDVSIVSFARGISSTPDGILFVADNHNNCIKKITPNGRTSILCGSYAGFKDGQGTQAQFFRPAGMTFTPDGTLYVADSGNNRIRRVTTDGTVTTLCGSDRAGAFLFLVSTKLLPQNY
jgi:glucose/arabinose dehydrogenase